MLKVILVFIIACLIQIFSKLKFVTQLYRHGARGPITNLYDGPEQGYMGGQLTATGMRQHYNLGQAMRKRYVEDAKLVSPFFNHIEMKVMSTDYNRTLQSAQSHLMGMFPLGTGPKLPQNLDSKYLLPPYKQAQQSEIGAHALPFGMQVFPVHTSNENYDYILAPWNFCTKVWDIIYEWYDQPEQQKFIKQIEKDFQPTVELTKKMINAPNLTTWDLPNVYDIIISDQFQGRRLPEGFDENSQLWKNITFITELESFFRSDQKFFLSQMNSFIFQEWLDNFDDVIKGENAGLKYMMMSAHDSNIAYVMPGLNLTNYQCIYQDFYYGKNEYLNCLHSPPYASNLLVELHQEEDTEEYYVMVDYNGKYAYLCERESIKCPYKEFKERLMVDIFSFDKMNQSCRNDPPKPEMKKKKKKSIEEKDDRKEELDQKDEDKATDYQAQIYQRRFLRQRD